MSDVKTRSIYIQNSKCRSVCELLSGAENTFACQAKGYWFNSSWRRHKSPLVNPCVGEYL